MHERQGLRRGLRLGSRIAACGIALLLSAWVASPAGATGNHKGVFPVLECVAKNVPEPGQYTAHWGYKNSKSTTLNIPVGTKNKFSPNPGDRGQPVYFSTGRHIDVFETVFSNSILVWSLTGPDGKTRTATATKHAIQRCRGCGDGVVSPGGDCDADDGDGDDDDDDYYYYHDDDDDAEECEAAEQCDDGNTASGDGCSASCQIEPGWSCTGAPSSCSPSCGDGVVTSGEGCDDGNAAAGDGCSALCQTEPGWTCEDAPSVCTPTCGDGLLTGNEGCDDGNTSPGDGCSALCQTEPGWTCSGAPSACAPTCGDGDLTGSEACDDGNDLADDGCSPTCEIEPGWSCTGAPSTCTPTCGNGLLSGSEACDDGNTDSGDGCSMTCEVEPGWSCTGAPSVCTTPCGDGLIVGGEACDDGNTASGDGCNASCQVEGGWSCTGAPSVCSTVCGDGLVTGTEACDDGDLDSGDGCSGVCQIEPGWSCTGAPSACSTTCGDGIPAGTEACDDGNTASGDGCSASCGVETGWACTGIPSVCTTPCGDGILAGAEQCDDGNTANGDCCSSSCTLEPPGSPCASDGNACTDDECNGAGVCTNVANSVPCEDGDLCTVGDACSGGACGAGGPKNCSDADPCTDDVCTAGVCSNPTLLEPPQADFILVADTSASMSKAWETWLSIHLGAFPGALTAAGIDWRIAIVRYGTYTNPRRGPQVPDLFLPWTSDATTFQQALVQLAMSRRRPAEAASEAMNLGLDLLAFRPNAIANIVLYTNEDDDRSVALSKKQFEPPAPGSKCFGKPCESRWLAAQARLDALVPRLLAQRVQMNMIIAPRDKPSAHQFGDPVCTVLTGGRLDFAATLACLQTNGAGRSIQAQLLSSGVCSAGTCTAGWIGRSCTADLDCSILARTYKAPRVATEGAAFFPGFLADKIGEQSCEP